MNFYSDCLRKALSAGQINESDKILVVGGGETDRKTFHDLGFKNVLITNLAPHAGQAEYAPYQWQREDAENLTFEDKTFDWAIEHAALHHLGSPHKGLLEMLRVSRHGVFVFEARDSALMRMAVRVGLTTEFELEPAFLSRGAGGGFRDTPIPNFVTRWKEAEVEKTVNSMYLSHRHQFEYFYGVNVPVQRFAMARSGVRRLIGKVLAALAPALKLLLGKQGNYFGFLVLKNVALQPWIKVDSKGELVPDIDFLAKQYDRTKYKRGS